MTIIRDIIADLNALVVERDAALAEIEKILAAVWMYDDKPHLLFSQLRALAQKYEKDPDSRDEMVRLMDEAYEGAPQ